MPTVTQRRQQMNEIRERPEAGFIMETTWPTRKERRRLAKVRRHNIAELMRRG